MAQFYHIITPLLYVSHIAYNTHLQWDIGVNYPPFHLLNLRILFYRSHIGATFLGQKCTKNALIYTPLTH